MKIKDKIIAILFLLKCTAYVVIKILQSQKWNMIIVDLETKTGREQLTYRISGGRYTLSSWKH